MEPRWQLQVAKNRLSEVVQEACSHGPQVITSRGQDKAVVISMEEYRRLTTPRGSLVQFFRDSPFVDEELDFERSGDTGRDFDW